MYGMIFALVFIGFVLEAIRIVAVGMENIPGEAIWSPVGWAAALCGGLRDGPELFGPPAVLGRDFGVSGIGDRLGLAVQGGVQRHRSSRS